MDGNSRHTRTSLGDKIGIGIIGCGIGMLLLGAGVLILFDVLGGFGTATGILWSLFGALLLGFMIAELPKDNAFQVDQSSTGQIRDNGAEIDIADDFAD